MKTIPRTFVLVGVLGVLVFGALAPRPAQAITLADLHAQVQALLAQIANLQAQNTAQTEVQTSSSVGAPTTIAVPTRLCTIMTRNLYQGVSGEDVTTLQEFLQDQGYFSADATGYYGPVTAAAVARWQGVQGISAVGAFGPLSRARLQVLCGKTDTTTPQCKPITYMPPLCSDGSAPQAVHDASGCLTGYTCPVENFTPPATCQQWSDGCNTCSRTSPSAPAACTMRACFAAGKGYCMAYFGSSASHTPTISSFSGPTTLSVGQTGTWSVQASDPSNGTLSYHISWGDEQTHYPLVSMSAAESFVQTTTFTHAYANAGTYTITVTVRTSAGLTATTSMTVQVGSGAVACTMEYAPVCGQPPEPACRHSVPACMVALQGPTTYSNRCMLNAAGATYLYDGACNANIEPVACTADAKQCPDGSWVGRTGANCQFVCPTN